MSASIQHQVSQYYGETLRSSDDLQTDACCTSAQPPQWLKPLLANVHPEALSRYYGCGIVAPAALENCQLLDLGCGSGTHFGIFPGCGIVCPFASPQNTATDNGACC